MNSPLITEIARAKTTGELHPALIKPFDEEVALPMCARQHVRDGNQMDVYALCAWKIRIMHLAAGQEIAAYAPGSVTQDFIGEVVRLSYFNDGPRLAREYLSKSGIHLVIERHLAKTYLDGAALLMPVGQPLIALTLRYDRLDNFWFTLAHELAHVALQLDGFWNFKKRRAAAASLFEALGGLRMDGRLLTDRPCRLTLYLLLMSASGGVVPRPMPCWKRRPQLNLWMNRNWNWRTISARLTTR